jgi:hypothetical protein
MTEPRKPHPIESLPFVFDQAPKSRTNPKRSFWHVEPTGDFHKDCRKGSEFAFELLRYEQEEKSGTSFLAMIVRQMPRDLSGIEVGFLETIGYAAQFGLLQAERRTAYWKRSEMYETHGALVNQRPDGSVVIEQPDGTRAVYRKEAAT